MTEEKLGKLKLTIGKRVAEMAEGMGTLSPLELHARMDSIRRLAHDHGLLALEELAHCSSQLALLPGHRVALTCALEHVDEAFACGSSQDTSAMMAALAIRLH